MLKFIFLFMPKILSIISEKDYQDHEYAEPKKILENYGHELITASTNFDVTGKFGSKAKIDILLQNVNPDDYDAVIFVGGPGSYVYFENKTCHDIAKKIYEAGKITTAICAAPAILAKAGLLKGKKATCYNGVSQILIENGANYTAKETETDENIITADGPQSASKFGETINIALKKI
jgi:protease I